MATYTTRAGLGKPTAGQSGWGTIFNRDFDQLDRTAPVGDFAVRPAAIDPTTGKATDLRVQAFGGFVEAGTDVAVTHLRGPGLLEAPSTRVDLPLATFTLPPSSLTNVYLDGDLTPQVTSTGTPQFGLAFPKTCVPLAQVYTDATKVTMIVDARHPAREIGCAYPLQLPKELVLSTVGGVAEATATPGATVRLVDATTRPVTIDLYPIAPLHDEAFLFVKRDASTNAVTIRPWPGGTVSADDPTVYPADTGPTVTLANQYDAAFLVADTSSAPGTWVKLKLA